tara:strand:- start:207 stop:563 length:357 start_codon:yes stop_codon:yes gene_type:complete
LNIKQSKIIIAGIAVLKRDALITCVCTRARYVKELNKPTLVKAKNNINGKLLIITSLNLIISLKVKGINISQTNDHLKNTRDIGGMSAKKANFPIMKFPAQNNVAQTNIMYALVSCMN